MKIGTRNIKSNLLRFLMVGAVLVSVGFNVAVQAIPITGSINMYGLATTDKADLTLATQFTSFGDVSVESGTGAYSGVPTGFQNVTWTPSLIWNPPNGSTPVTPLWKFTVGSVTYSFDLDTLSFTTGGGGSGPGDSWLELFGSGTATISGGTYDPTFGDWNFSTTSKGSITFAFNSDRTTVPDGGTSVILLGIALSSLGILRSLSKHVA